MNVRGLPATIGNRDADADVFDSRFGVFDKDIKIAIIVEHSGVEELVLRISLGTTAVLLGKL